MGFFRADSDAMRWVLVGLTAVIAGFVAVWMWREKARGDVLALGLVLGGALGNILDRVRFRSEEHTSELQSLMRTSYAVFCLKKKKKPKHRSTTYSTRLSTISTLEFANCTHRNKM